MINDLWYKNAVIYNLSVDTFMDADGDGVGDFKGLVRRLDYLQGLGVTAIWLMPFQPYFDPFRSVILTVDPSDAAKLAIVRRLRAGAASEVVPARIVDYRSTSVSIDVATSKSDRMLMLNDANVPGWRASVDGSPATVFDADYLFRGVYIPAGSHRVEFWFEPSGFEVASVFALGSLVLCLTLIGYDTRRSFRRRR